MTMETASIAGRSQEQQPQDRAASSSVRSVRFAATQRSSPAGTVICPVATAMVIRSKDREMRTQSLLGQLDEDAPMKKGRSTEAQIMVVLRRADGGVAFQELCREHGIGTATFCRWAGEAWRHGCVVGEPDEGA